MQAFRAIFVNTLLQIVRMRAPLFLSLFSLVFVIAIALAPVGDGTVKGHLQVVMTYVLHFSSFFLCLITIMLSVGVLRREWKEKQLFLLDSKPASRAMIFMAKYAALLFFNAMFLLLLMIFLWGAMQWIIRDTETPKARILAEHEVLSSRIACWPEYNEIMTKTNESRKRHYAVNWNHEIQWIFRMEDYKPEGRPITIRFKFYATGNSNIRPVNTFWSIGDPGTRFFARIPLKRAVNTFQDINITDRVINDGKLMVSVRNMSEDRSDIMISLAGGVGVYARSRGLVPNMLKAYVLILMQVAFLTAVGMALTTFMSTPVSMITTGLIYIITLVRNSTFSAIPELPWKNMKSYMDMLSSQQKETPSVVFKSIQTIGDYCGYIFPNFNTISPVQFLQLGLAIPAQVFWYEGLLYTSLRILFVLGIAIWFFHGAEVGLVNEE